MHTQVDPENYEYIPEKKRVDYYDNDAPMRVAIYGYLSFLSPYIVFGLCNIICRKEYNGVSLRRGLWISVLYRNENGAVTFDETEKVRN